MFYPPRHNSHKQTAEVKQNRNSPTLFDYHSSMDRKKEDRTSIRKAERKRLNRKGLFRPPIAERR